MTSNSAFVPVCTASLSRSAFHGQQRSSRTKPPVARRQLASTFPARFEMSAGPSFTDHVPVAEKPETLVRPDESYGDQSMRARFEKMIRVAQDDICAQVEALDGCKFHEDSWVRENGGGGISRVLQNGNVFEKAGVNVSVVYGTMPPEAVAAASARGVTRNVGYEPGEPVPFFAAGISSVMHPKNPMAPTMHFNYRYFETDRGLWWFGGGTDLTPAYVFEEDVKHFHSTLKACCDRHDQEYYPKYKKWCDDYFLIKHRGERRGLGGIFFDDLNDRDAGEIFEFSEDCASNVCNAYLPIVERRKDSEYTEDQKKWQQLRRARYVEYNLVYDRGTVFGLKTGGRIESILMSLPLTARWEYDHSPEPGSWEAQSLEYMKNPKDWA
ncbi:coproporphyrinogen III oxidase [Gracilaria domingensis]|nr:coproporphyrinogen III oxidase [Gracilaria domingensis]